MFSVRFSNADTACDNIGLGIKRPAGRPHFLLKSNIHTIKKCRFDFFSYSLYFFIIIIDFYIKFDIRLIQKN
jgi:hypothetical protein